MIYRVRIAQVLAIFVVTLTACEEKHEFSLGKQVRRKYNRDISGVMIRRTNYDGKGDVYYIKLPDEPWDTNVDGPNRADELERIP